MMPTYLGEPLYPAGFPLKPEQIRYNDKTIQDIFLDYCGQIKTKESENILKEFVLYYINAPVFDSEFTRELTENKDLNSLSLDDLIMKCLDYGLDPF
jgi:hypothetical protein